MIYGKLLLFTSCPIHETERSFQRHVTINCDKSISTNYWQKTNCDQNIWWTISILFVNSLTRWNAFKLHTTAIIEENYQHYHDVWAFLRQFFQFFFFRVVRLDPSPSFICASWSSRTQKALIRRQSKGQENTLSYVHKYIGTSFFLHQVNTLTWRPASVEESTTNLPKINKKKKK